MGEEKDVNEIVEAAARGMTLIYGPPGCGKTSVAMRLASRLDGRVMWVSTAEGPDLLAQVARRLGVDSSKFDFLDFPRAFQKDILRYILDHVGEYGVVVVDSVEGVAGRQNIDIATHSVLYQVAKEKPVILIAEEETPRLAYVADHVVHVWCRINKLGHMMRYIQLEKSRVRPPSPRYIFEIVEGVGIAYAYPLVTRGHTELLEDEALGITAPAHSVLCVHSKSIKNLVNYLSKIKEEAIYITVGHWTPFHGVVKDKRNMYVIRITNDAFRLIHDVASGKIRPSYVVVGGLLNVPEEDRADYVTLFYILLSYVKFLLFVDVGPKTETEKLEKFCEDVIRV
jgi:KaiC/GvpD/RAD55 family RecA-like ATPase